MFSVQLVLRSLIEFIAVRCSCIGSMAPGLLALTLLMASCNPTNPTSSSLANPTFQLSLDDQPLANANVLFLPLQTQNEFGRYQPWSYGTTDENGILNLKTSERSPGAVPGIHRVIISRQTKSNDEFPAANFDWSKLPQNPLAITSLLDREEMPQSLCWPSLLQIHIAPPTTTSTQNTPIEIKLSSKL